MSRAAHYGEVLFRALRAGETVPPLIPPLDMLKAGGN